MADVLQGLKESVKLPSFSMPAFGMKEILWIGIILEIIVTFVFIYIVIHIWRKYSVRLVALEDMGKSYRAKIMWAKPIMEDGIPKYQILGKKDSDSTFFKPRPLKIPAFPSDVKIPLRGAFGFYKDLIIVHKDKNGDFRPFKALVSKDQFDLQKYVTNEKFNFDNFFSDLLPTLQIDNVKMRSWYKMKVNETMNIYKDPVSGLSKIIRPDIMLLLFVVFCVMIGAYMIFA